MMVCLKKLSKPLNLICTPRQTDRRTDRQTDRGGVLQYLPSRAFGAAGDKNKVHVHEIYIIYVYKQVCQNKQ